MDLSAKIRYTDTSYIIAQQWSKGGEKHTFPNVYACNYNRQKFANLAKCDEKQTIPTTAKAIKRPLPVVPPMPPTPPPPAKPDDLIEDDNKIDADEQREVLPSNGERKQKKRRTRSLERLRDQSNDIELSDSDEDIAIAQKIPIIKCTDEVDASATSPSMSEAINAHSNTTADEPAICADSPGLAIDANTFSDKSQLSFDEILKIEETFDDDGAIGFMNQSIVVDIHAEPTIELRIHESDSDPAIVASKSVTGILNAFKLTKEQMKSDFEQERCFSEDDAVDPDADDNKEKPERLVQSDSEVLSKTPLKLVIECDINENVIVNESKSRETILDLDHNHNDIVKAAEIVTDQTQIKTKQPRVSETNAEIKFVQNRESPPIVPQNEQPKHESISSRSSCESDGNEPVYATVDTALNTKNYDAKPLISKSQTFPLKLSQHYHHDKTAADHLGLNYVTERILASVLPHRVQNQQQKRDNELADGPHIGDAPQDIYEQELISMLEQKHGKNYKLFDLESCISTITLEKLCELCKHMDCWLGSGREKVVILQDRGDRQRLGSAIAAYLEYLNICASSYAHRNGLSNEDARAQSSIARNWLDLDIFSMKKFLLDVIGPLRVPSHRRYLQYFSGLLSGKIRINSHPLYLRFVTIESPPSWLQHEKIALQQAEWRSFIKIYEGLNCVFTSDIHVIPITTRQFIYEIGQLRLRGDVIIRCYQITANERTMNLHSTKLLNRELIFSTQFHTCAITERDVTFYRNDLDYACDDPRIPIDHKVTLHFGDNQLNENRGLYFQSPLVKLEPLNAVAKYNSLERFDDDSLHTQGPLDGSLYATILKSPRSPLRSPTFPPAFISNIVNNNHQRSNTNLTVVSSTPKPERTSSTQNLLISPPPEFSNKKIVEIKECYTTVSPIGASPKPESNTSTLNREQSKSLSRSYTSTPSYEEIQVPSRSSSRDATLRYQTTPRSSSSLSTVYQQPEPPNRSSSASRAGNYTTNQSNQYLRTVDNYNYVNAVQNGNRNQSYQDGRESVKSPLTLSMDSGISSSGIANRRIQGSSVSPSSYPSQSPQDRHQELDDILSDMLLTVQGIPDIGKTQHTREVLRKTTTQNSTVQNQRPQLHLQIPKHQQQQQQPLYASTNTVKRSQSCTSQEESNCSTISRSTVHTTGHIRDRVCGDFYDTASTATTITPTPSESGRITPFQTIAYTRNSNSSANHHHENTKLTQQAIEQRERELIMDLQNQSFDYSQSLRTGSSAAGQANDLKLNNNKVNISATSEDDESIPYHAREDSRPFTYGDATGVQLSPTSARKAGTGGTGMIKLQAGLSSPSLVRKHLGSNANQQQQQQNAARKSPSNGRNDFEEMLLQRREKILNDKYSIGDKTPNGNSVSETNNLNASANNKWNISSNTLNGYQYHEPLKRSNTMDGGFGRGNTSGYVSDGSSGQTWLQLQQQKLRAKKELQHRGDNDYYERNTNTGRPLRSRSSQSSHRYDGYSSDTGAFDSRAFTDEVDYRRPLHVQTPNRPNERYHTITKTTTMTNERPFVSVKRAHEQSKANNNIIGSPSPLSILNASPHGHIAQAQSPNHNQNGLLSVADNNELSPVRNGHARLESDSSNSSPLSSSNMSSSSPSVTASPPLDNRTIACDSTDKVQQPNSGTTTNGPMMRNYHTKAPIIIEENGNEIDDDTSYMALDQLLASLALENDIMERHLSQINNNDTNGIKFKHQNQTNGGVFSFETNARDHYISSNGNYPKAKTNGFDENLNDVLANLIEFTENESQPPQQQHQQHNTNIHMNSYANGHHLVNGSNSNHHNHHPHLPHFNHLNNNFNNNNNHISSNYVTTNGNGINNNHINRAHNYHEPSNNAIKRLTSESENSSSVSPSLSERSNGIVSWSDQVREESFSSYRSETEPETSLAGSPRPETPAFPLTPRTPYGLNGNSPALPPKSPTSIRRLNMIHNNGSTWSLRSGRSTATTYDWSKEFYSGGQTHHINQNDVSCYTSRRNSTTSTANSEPQEIAPHLVKFVRDSSKFWYKPTISREEAIALLRNALPGSFLVRDSTTFAKAFGLVLKVAHPPPGVQSKGTGDELVRHFLVEPTTRGVRLKGCSNEPVFTSLSALVYQHSITPLALPCKLIIPDRDLQNVEYHSPAQQQLMTQGAACNVLFLFTCDTESLTGPEAIRKAVSLLYSRKPLPKPTEVHFKVTQQGITLTDNTRQLFFRKHYPASNISFCGLDPDDRRWSIRVTGEVPVSNKTIFAFVARRSTSSNDNQCHVFCELEQNQPAAAITAFANKVIPSYGAQPYLRDI
ncbi:uncharacterized protein LOC129569175 isoform X2 [Sitodiplosis mosellana]|uniref:uncharacterized protein LOC129569175 isoform X2 n=1 Tax=Sitodiplosis mosellana TaxID=263140 RepID=UPI002443CBF0|nr:uncharacterized protein LOC129569175 isoform X2 [Sitodiplosis mosellana]